MKRLLCTVFFISFCHFAFSQATNKIDSIGNVGIRTTSPNTALEVNGIARFTGPFGFSIGGDAGQARIHHYGVGNEFGLLTSGNAYAGLRTRAISIGLNYGDLNAPTYGAIIQGNLGIGTSSPSGKVHIMSNPSNWVALRIGPEGNHHSYVRVDRHHGKDGGIILSENGGSKYQLVNLDNDDFSIYSYTKNDWVFAIQANTGNIGIATTTPTEKLEVAGNARIVGNIYSKKVKVSATAGSWPDYVFESDYALTPLSQLESFVKTNKHLPEVPSAKEIAANGQDLGDIQATLLKKVEELTLYLIQEKKDKEQLKAENQELRALFLELKYEIDQLKKDK